ncbi:unnamed protein product, partial [Callosobruchus maculatus]
HSPVEDKSLLDDRKKNGDDRSARATSSPDKRSASRERKARSRESRSDTPPHVKKQEQHSRKNSDKSFDAKRKQRQLQPVVKLRASSSEAEREDDAVAKDGTDFEDVGRPQVDDKELRMLRLLKSGLAAKAKETLERKKERPAFERQQSAAPLVAALQCQQPAAKKHIEPDLFDIRVLPLKQDGATLVRRAETAMIGPLNAEETKKTAIDKDAFDIAAAATKARSRLIGATSLVGRRLSRSRSGSSSSHSSDSSTDSRKSERARSRSRSSRHRHHSRGRRSSRHRRSATSDRSTSARSATSRSRSRTRSRS